MWEERASGVENFIARPTTTLTGDLRSGNAGKRAQTTIRRDSHINRPSRERWRSWPDWNFAEEKIAKLGGRRYTVFCPDGQTAPMDCTAIETPEGKPDISDYDLLRCIGRGSYGQVWLARGVAQTYRAIKVVYRDRFEDARPFERELAGLRRFDPISRANEGLIDVLHVGQNNGYFYYVMELGDDATDGQNIRPN